MPSLDVYPLYDVTPVRAQGHWVWDEQGRRYLDFYGGHAVISIGHSHPAFVQALTDQLGRLAFYSNAVQKPAMDRYADALAQASGYPDYRLFLCNSGAEANENAFKLAAFHTGGSKVLAFKGAFHGRTSAAVAATDNPKIGTALDAKQAITFLPLNDEEALHALDPAGFACAIVEGLQGVAGIYEPSADFLQALRAWCTMNGIPLILDEIQSGFGRTGRFFAHQHAGIVPDLITVAKGMGNGFPIGGVLVHPAIQAWHGMLGTTFGGNYLAIRAGQAVLDVLASEELMQNAHRLGSYVSEGLNNLPGVAEVRGRGLMLALELQQPAGPLRKRLLFEHGIFTGSAAEPHTVRLLPPLSIDREACDLLLDALRVELAP